MLQPSHVQPTESRAAKRAGFLPSFSSRSIDAADAFDAETTERLRAAKAAYDPDGLFVSNQPVGS